ncbi:UDP-glycosyltransferase UGT340C2 precursor [Bombyx mori]|uniref:UDP-glucuronosyltransferase n=1 Tax=Bombyx mori TaxID=7091 RepID=G9LPT6_BOMMO|nr:UDP-glycosyltransferase UGT340C2 precursor [Bombyx mori]AEW43159.1 UDP-glycosyltransferase UGT340C2 [Bombyx mori]
MKSIALYFLLSIFGVESARILGVFPMPSISHQVVFRALSMELARRGHELVIITTDPALPKNRPKDNITEIDISRSYQLLRKFDEYAEKTQPIQKRGVISGVEIMISEHAAGAMFMLMAEVFNSEEVNQLLQDKNQKFDLIISEAIMSFHLIIGKIFNAPVILFSSLYGLPETFETVGAVTRHPILYPHLFRNKFTDLTLFEKIREVYYEARLTLLYWGLQNAENNYLKSRFGENAPTVQQLRENVCMVFLNSFPLFDNNRPVPPNVVYLGALHLQPVKELPEDLKTYLDNSKRGVVYASLGTNVRASAMSKEFLETFIKAFEALPYDILWKIDGDDIKAFPKNVRVQKWFPQRDLLVHPNIVAFVTQGGLQSTDEAIDAGVPLVGIPLIADQWYNVNKYKELGIGISLDSFTVNAEELAQAVKTVATDKSFKNNIAKIKTLMHDQPLKPLERAVWWTEHVLRNGGSKHLRSPAANMNYSEYLMLDVVLALLFLFFTVISILALIAYKLFGILKKMTFSGKLKSS